jgi:uncharacterized protein with PIN domain
MPPNNCDPEHTTADPTPADERCPKCGSEMEPIDSSVEGLPVQHLQLCPRCYLVMWRDRDGLHVRQGVPMRAGSTSTSMVPGGLVGEPTEC